ncbi:MAG: undecaprenyl-diphosphate phosphatase [Provencibacterium sp.]|jgi:undecaprenyl-diphosphatase|nr:undecaprenyl-diphosphate phosphatase [Provencibacterium sp.]
MQFLEILKTVLFGIVEGITEWLPISSTGHMILLDEFISLSVSPEFWEMFLVVIQLGAILAVVFLYWGKLFPFSFRGGFRADREKFSMWFKILVASVPAGIVGVFFGDIMDALFYNYVTVAIMLILFGILFILVENRSRGSRPQVNCIADISYRSAFFIGIFQMIAAIFPGTSRSGATIVGALLIGISRSTAAEFTFFLAIPAMFGGSALKLLKFGLNFSSEELVILLCGMLVAFLVSIFAIRFLVGYIKKHNFKVFGWYRIALGALVLVYFFVRQKGI